MNKIIKKLLLSRGINKIGNIFYDYGNSIWLASMGSIGKKFLAYYQMVDTLTSILLNPISGALVDRFKRRKILLYTDFICFISCLLASFVSNNNLMLYTLVIVNIILAVSSSFSRIANKSIITEVVEKDEIVNYNSKLEITNQVISVCSPIFSFVVIQFTSLRVILLIDALSFLLSFICIKMIKIEEIKYQIESKKGTSLKSVLSDILEGIIFVYKEKEILLLLILSSLINFIFAGFAYILPYSDKLFSMNGAFATMLSLGALGSILAALVSYKVKSTMRNLHINLILSGLGISVIGLYKFVNLPIIVFLFGNFLVEFFMTIFNIHYLSQIQIKVSNELMGRVFSCVFTVAIILMPLGTFVLSKIPGSINLITFFLLGILVMLISFISMTYSRVKFGK
ncbi:MFS transporter [Helcococcus bovis]|uniref:MFS transporter n=1 Tax=Helcococcus bovis TaxID=3153252 RepID=UPI0038BBC638